MGHAEIPFKLVAWSHLQEFSSFASWLTQKRLSDWVRVFLDRIMDHAETSFRLATRSLLQSFPRLHRGSRRNSKIGYEVSPAEISSAASWLTHKRLSEWLRRPTWRFCSAEFSSIASWLTQEHRYVVSLVKIYLFDRIVFHAKTSLRSPRIDLLRCAKLS